MNEYVVIFDPPTFLTAPGPARVGKRATTTTREGHEPITYYRLILTGKLREVARIVEELNAASKPKVEIVNTP